jgi:hypothetical protein
MQQMLATLVDRIKLAVDVKRCTLAGGGAMHADCEMVLIQDGSLQEDVWGADWLPSEQAVGYESLINIRPRQGNRKLEIEDPTLRRSIEQIVTALMSGVPHA